MTEREVSSERVSEERLEEMLADAIGERDRPIFGDGSLYDFHPSELVSALSELHALRSSVKTVPEALEQVRIAVEAEAAAKAKRDQFLATIYVNVQKSEPTAEFAVALRDFVREEWPKLSAIEAPSEGEEVAGSD